MKLLLDENIPLCIKESISSKSVRTRHVSELKKGITDKEVFKIAIENKECIVTKDHHFDRFIKCKHYGIIRLNNSLSNFGEKELKLAISKFKNKMSLENVYLKVNKDGCTLKFNKYSKNKYNKTINF